MKRGTFKRQPSFRCTYKLKGKSSIEPEWFYWARRGIAAAAATWTIVKFYKKIKTG